MRTESAASLKRKHSRALQNIPREGSRIRIVYDILMANKGKPVIINALVRIVSSQIIIQLTDIYGLDIRVIRHPQPHKRGSTPASYILAGEWFGSVYVDYVAERLAQLEKEQS